MFRSKNRAWLYSTISATTDGEPPPALPTVRFTTAAFPTGATAAAATASWQLSIPLFAPLVANTFNLKSWPGRWSWRSLCPCDITHDSPRTKQQNRIAPNNEWRKKHCDATATSSQSAPYPPSIRPSSEQNLLTRFRLWALEGGASKLWKREAMRVARLERIGREGSVLCRL